MHISAYICDTALAPVRCRVSQVFPLESKNRTYNYIITYRIVNGDCTYSFERFGPILRTKNVCLGVNGNPVSAFVLRCVIDADPLYLSEFLSWSRQEFRSASRSDYVIPLSHSHETAYGLFEGRSRALSGMISVLNYTPSHVICLTLSMVILFALAKAGSASE